MEKVYDLTALKQMLDNSEEEINMMVKMFVELSPKTLAEIKENAALQKWVTVGDLAHKMKSSLKIMGLRELADLALFIEINGRKEQNIKEIESKIEEMGEKLAEIVSAMRKDYP